VPALPAGLSPALGTRLPERSATRSPRSGARRGDAADRSLALLAAAERRLLAAERPALADGLLQRLHPTVRTLGLLGLVVLTAMLTRPAALLALFGIALLLARRSGVPWRGWLGRAWLSVPPLVALAALPAFVLGVPEPGLVVLRLVLRAGVALSFVLLLGATTPGGQRIAALRAVGVPRTYAFVASLTARHLIALVRTAREMLLARRSRSAGRTRWPAAQRRLGATVGALLLRAQARTEGAHLALLARGFRGDAPRSERRRPRALDLAFGAACALVAGLAAWVEAWP
jgi:cobalt/nickel transport system permease protein